MAAAVPRHIPNFERILQTTFPMSSPVQDAAGNLSISSLNGDIYTLNQENSMQVSFSTGGQPQSIVYDAQNSAYVADIAHQAILSVAKIQDNLDIGQMVKDYQGAPLKGPSSLLLTPSTLFFTDSGPLGQTNLENSKGSLFAIDLQVNLLKPIVYNCLSGPQGLASWNSTSSASGYGGLVIFVSQTYKNRVLRVAQQSNGQFHTSVFYQFSGRLGPTALSVHQDGTLFVARPDFPDIAKDGIISAINIQTGTHEYDLALPGMPDITGISFSRQQKDLLYVTESTTNSILKVSLEQQ